MAVAAETYNTKEVAYLTGVSVRQLQWWDERGIVSPAQAKHGRMYTREDVLVVRAVAGLRWKGVHLREVRAMLNVIRRLASEYLIVADGRARWCLTDGEVIALMKTAKRGAVLIHVQGAGAGNSSSLLLRSGSFPRAGARRNGKHFVAAGMETR